jgi:response regulator of citrate/malate metabolism
VIDVLVVDDDFMVARIHVGFVERTPGFQVVGVAHTGADAVAQVRLQEPDLVLLDIYLPDLGGLEVLQELRTVAPEVDVLVISAAREAETVRRAWRGGVVHYLMKPFTYDALRERLEHYAHAHQGLRVATTAEQADVDRIFGGRPATGDVRLPKGLSPQTRRLVEQALRAAGTLSAAECAGEVGISRVSARRYLEYLTTCGTAEVSLRYGTTGRPERRYTWLR